MIAAYTNLIIGPGTGHMTWGMQNYGASFATSAWPGAGRIHYYPFTVHTETAIVQAGIQVTTHAASTNFKIGIYSAAGARLAQTADIPTTVAAGWKGAAISYTLEPATLYYLAGICDSTSPVFSRWPTPTSVEDPVATQGAYDEVGTGSTLPATATFSSFAKTGGIFNFVLSTNSTIPIAS